MLVLGGSAYHPGGIEAFCERTVTAVNRHGDAWRATWWQTDNAYLKPRTFADTVRAWRRLSRANLRSVDVVWLQWSTLADLLILRRVIRLGLPVMVTPHLGANARLQRMPLLRGLCVRLLERADHLALLFDAQDREIALPPGIPRSTLGTFLPEETLREPAPARANGPFRLLHAGRLSRPKGTFRLIEICAGLRARGVPFQARIVGRADERVMAELRAAIADAGLDDAIELAGWMNGAELRQALSEADVLVHLSELDSFPLIVLEALAAGALPLVADMAGAASMARAYDGLVVPRAEIEPALDWIASANPAQLRERGARAAERVRGDHDWDAAVRRLEQIAQATAHGHRSAAAR